MTTQNIIAQDARVVADDSVHRSFLGTTHNQCVNRKRKRDATNSDFGVIIENKYFTE